MTNTNTNTTTAITNGPTRQERLSVAMDAAQLGRLTKLIEHFVEDIAIEGGGDAATSSSSSQKSLDYEDRPWQLKKEGSLETQNLRSSQYQIINEAAALGQLKRLKPVEVTSQNWGGDENSSVSTTTTQASSSTYSLFDYDHNLSNHGERDREQRSPRSKFQRGLRASVLVENHLQDAKKTKFHSWSPVTTLERMELLQDLSQYAQQNDGSTPSNTSDRRAKLLPSLVVPQFRKHYSGLTKQKQRELSAQQVAEEAHERNVRLQKVGLGQDDPLRITHECSCKYCCNPTPYQTREYQRLRIEQLLGCSSGSQEQESSSSPSNSNSKLPTELVPMLALTTTTGPRRVSRFQIKETMNQVIQKVVVQAWERRQGKRGKDAYPQVTEKCSCTYCQHPSASQTRRYQELWMVATAAKKKKDDDDNLPTDVVFKDDIRVKPTFYDSTTTSNHVNFQVKVKRLIVTTEASCSPSKQSSSSIPEPPSSSSSSSSPFSKSPSPSWTHKALVSPVHQRSSQKLFPAAAANSLSTKALLSPSYPSQRKSLQQRSFSSRAILSPVSPKTSLSSSSRTNTSTTGASRPSLPGRSFSTRAGFSPVSRSKQAVPPPPTPPTTSPFSSGNNRGRFSGLQTAKSFSVGGGGGVSPIVTNNNAATRVPPFASSSSGGKRPSLPAKSYSTRAGFSPVTSQSRKTSLAPSSLASPSTGSSTRPRLSSFPSQSPSQRNLRPVNANAPTSSANKSKPTRSMPVQYITATAAAASSSPSYYNPASIPSFASPLSSRKQWTPPPSKTKAEPQLPSWVSPGLKKMRKFGKPTAAECANRNSADFALAPQYAKKLGLSKADAPTTESMRQPNKLKQPAPAEHSNRSSSPTSVITKKNNAPNTNTNPSPKNNVVPPATPSSAKSRPLDDDIDEEAILKQELMGNITSSLPPPPLDL